MLITHDNELNYHKLNMSKLKKITKVPQTNY